MNLANSTKESHLRGFIGKLEENSLFTVQEPGNSFLENLENLYSEIKQTLFM